MFFVRLGGLAEQRVIRGLSDREELGQLLFDGAVVDDRAVVGEVGRGWDVAMYLLQWERGMYAWQRHCWLLERYETLCGSYPDLVDSEATEIGWIAARLVALRSRCLGNLALLDAGQFIGPEASVEKVLLAEVEIRLFDLFREIVPLGVAGDGGIGHSEMVADYFYSRFASVYGGSEEIQLDTIAERLLDLPRDPAKATRGSSGA
jgi:alkylation response protein AidB-like acyl-CoA dehydrogenase